MSVINQLTNKVLVGMGAELCDDIVEHCRILQFLVVMIQTLHLNWVLAFFSYFVLQFLESMWNRLAFCPEITKRTFYFSEDMVVTRRKEKKKYGN